MVFSGLYLSTLIFNSIHRILLSVPIRCTDYCMNAKQVVRNCNFVVRNGKLWYEMVMEQNSYDTKWFLVMVRNCNFVVRNGNVPYVFCTITISYHNLPFSTTKLQFRTITRNHFVPYVFCTITISYHM
jgi:hypothetical protein